MNKKILVIDDEKNIRITLKQCLLSENYDLELAINGEEGLRKIKEENYDLILLDIKMPGLTGMEVLKKLRSEGNKVSIIMMTAYGTVDKAVEAMKLGAIDFISKPFTPSEIKEIVENVIKRKDLKEDNIESFKDIIEYSKKCILDRDYNKAEEFLKLYISKNADSPEPHNLLGILYEYRRDINLAQKHYRASLALDPTYKPAEKNLERTAQMSYTREGVNFGEAEDAE